jgi:hypothetical protein
MELEFPESFPEFNSGVMVYKDSEKIKDFFSEWNDYYSDIDREMVPYETNQPALRAALYRSNIKYITLRKEYNFQINHHRSARGRIKYSTIPTTRRLISNRLRERPIHSRATGRLPSMIILAE